MRSIYPGQGLGVTDRPVIGFTLGYQPVSVFVWFETWIQLEGIEPPPEWLEGQEDFALLKGRAMVPLSGAMSSMSGTGVAPPVLEARGPSPPLAAAEPSVLMPPSGSGARLSAKRSDHLLSGEPAAPVQGTEYDDEIEGKERGW